MMFKIYVFISLWYIIQCKELEQKPKKTKKYSNDEDHETFYKYGYDVESQGTGDVKSLKEARDGDMVTGEYSVNDPDGFLRTVKYTVDKEKGFQAKVTRTKIEYFDHSKINEYQYDTANSNAPVPVSSVNFVGQRENHDDEKHRQTYNKPEKISYNEPEGNSFVVPGNNYGSEIVVGYGQQISHNYQSEPEEIVSLIETQNELNNGNIKHQNEEAYNSLYKYENTPVSDALKIGKENLYKKEDEIVPYITYPTPEKKSIQHKKYPLKKFKAPKLKETELVHYNSYSKPKSEPIPQEKYIPKRLETYPDKFENYPKMSPQFRGSVKFNNEDVYKLNEYLGHSGVKNEAVSSGQFSDSSYVKKKQKKVNLPQNIEFFEHHYKNKEPQKIAFKPENYELSNTQENPQYTLGNNDHLNANAFNYQLPREYPTGDLPSTNNKYENFDEQSKFHFSTEADQDLAPKSYSDFKSTHTNKENDASDLSSATEKLEPVVQEITESAEYPTDVTLAPQINDEVPEIKHSSIDEIRANAPLYNLLDVHPRKYYRKRHNLNRRIVQNIDELNEPTRRPFKINVF